MEKQKPGIKRACEYISTLKQENEESSLPPIRQLARSAGVSFVTMWKAIRYLLDNGAVISRGNRLIVIKNSSEQVPAKDNSSVNSEPGTQITVSQRNCIVEKLYKDILTGRFSGDDKLPSCKELQRFYNVSFATLKKTLSVLTEQRIIETRGNSYYIPSLTGSTGWARIVAIGCGWEDGKIWVDYQDKNYFRSLESECMRMNIQLDVIIYYRKQGRLRFINTASRKEYDLNDRTILGYIFIVANLDSTPEEVLERLSGLGRSIAVLDVVGGWKIPSCARNNSFIQFFTATASVLPAKRVAQYLLSKGHKKIAFFSPFHLALWSKKRLSTIIETYKFAGINDGVISFVLNEYAYQWDYLKNHIFKEDLRTLMNQYTEWKKETNSEVFKRLGNLGYSFIKYITEWNCASGLIYEKMKSLFDKALTNKSITAWVMSNDFTATIALDYLKDCGVRVPEDISIISFDNTIDAMEYHLTSYDFNNLGIITMILRFILAPHTMKLQRRGGCIEVDGTLVVRHTS